MSTIIGHCTDRAAMIATLSTKHKTVSTRTLCGQWWGPHPLPPDETCIWYPAGPGEEANKTSVWLKDLTLSCTACILILFQERAETQSFPDKSLSDK